MASFNRIVARTLKVRSEIRDVEKRWTLPVWMRLPMLKSFNFILYHYIYLILMTIIGSILLYPPGGIRYIDAIFFAAGAATQSGLNTIDVNTLFLYQQIVLLFIATLCNPITINTFVVFVRLYWFEKRFQHIVRDARTLRSARTRSRTKSMEQNQPDLGQLERGVGGRQITILNQNLNQTPIENGKAPGSVEQENSSRPGTSDQGPTDPPAFRRDIMFADEIQSPEQIKNEDRVPEQRSKDQHIAFVENQRKSSSTALRIPGPRDFERGFIPERVETNPDERGPLDRRGSGFSDDGHPHKAEPTDTNAEDLSDPSNKLKIHPRITLPNQIRRDSSPISVRARAQRVSSFMGRSFSKGVVDTDPLPYLSYTATIGRNSMFVDLTEEQREELGGIEYRSLKTLAVVLLVYNIGFTIFGIIILLPWIVRSKQYSEIVQADGQSPVWWGIFTPVSSFTDLGFTLTPDSMISFQTAWLPLLLGSFLIVIGNTGFPVMLRFMIWICSAFSPFGSGVWEEFRFLLDHPRRCFTLLFPRKATWWLFWVLIVLNSIDIIFFIILDLKDPAVTSLPGGYQFLDGLFQAASTRTAGFACVNLANLHPGIQVSYLIMMYISVFPIAISVRQTNVYEEKSLGIYGAERENDEDDDNGPITRSYIGNHLRRQLSFDLWYVFLGLFFICIIEGDRIANINDPDFSTFSVLFEIVSAYGTVGLSLGYPNTNASFSGQFHTLSKLIIIAMMIRGRHRGLPYALDRAILLPGEGLKTDKARRESESRPSERVQAAAMNAAAHADQEEKRNHDRSRRKAGIAKIISGALSAGPGIKEKRG